MSGDDPHLPQDSVGHNGGEPPQGELSAKKKAPISFGAAADATDAWNVVPGSAMPTPQPLKRAPITPSQPPAADSQTPVAQPEPLSPPAVEPIAPKEVQQPGKAESAPPARPTKAENNERRASHRPSSKSKVGANTEATRKKTEAGTSQKASPPPRPRQPLPVPRERTGKAGKFPSIAVSPGAAAESPGESEAPGPRAWWQRIRDAAFNQTPAWLISLVVHFLLVVVLALLSMSVYVKEPYTVTATYAEQLGEQLEHEILVFDSEELLLDSHSGALEQWSQEDDASLARTLTDIALSGLEAARPDDEPMPGADLMARSEGATRRALLKAYGGNATTEQAVAEALLWLKRNQQRDGSWSLTGDYADGAGVENKVAATAMALLAFQGAGHTDRAGEHAKTVERGWKYLLGELDADGNFIQGSLVVQHRTYSQAMATIALCELYAMTGDSALREQAQKTIDYAVAWQAAEGGWRYVPKSESDMSVSGWYVMALQSARMSKLDVPTGAIESVSRFLDSVSLAPSPDETFPEGSRYRYLPRPNYSATPAMTAEGLLCRQYLGWKQDDPRLVSGVEYLLRHPISWETPNVYYWYYATQVMHHQEGEAWQAWNAKLRQLLPEKQVKTGREKGSWSPAHDDNGSKAGRLFMTCFCTYMLEVYYRHLPIYSKHQLMGL